MSDPQGGWMPGDPSVPIDQSLEERIVTTIESMSVVWNMSNIETGMSLPVPMMFLTFYTRGGEPIPTLVLTLGAVSSLVSDLGVHLTNCLGGVAPISGELTDEGLQRLLDDVLPPHEGDES